MYKYLKNPLVLLLALTIASCSSSDEVLHDATSLEGAYIAVLDNAICDRDFKKSFPKSHAVHFKSSSEFLLALAIGKCNAGVAEREEGEALLDKRGDYAALSFAETDTTLVIAHGLVVPGGKGSVQDKNLLDRSIQRIRRSIISDGYWILILKGFATTITMFVLGILLAFTLAIIMSWMNTRKYLRFISQPVSYFIRTIHDVPSIVLIFFFYYIVFASAHVSGIIICSISLGVYTSGSLMNVFNVHLNQIDRNQHAAAHMLGLTGWKKYKYVILPQAVKPMLPLIGAEAKVLLRATTYAGYISELDLVKVTEIIRNQTYDVFVPLLFVSVVFLVFSNIIVESLSAIYNKAFKYD